VERIRTESLEEKGCDMTLHSHQMESPVGLLTLVANEEALVAILWEEDDPARVRLGPARAIDLCAANVRACSFAPTGGSNHGASFSHGGVGSADLPWAKSFRPLPGRDPCEFREQDLRQEIRQVKVNNPRHPVLRETERQLAEYFARQRRAFDLPLAPAGTPFQRRIWAALQEIPYGETRSYSQLAAAVGSPNASRAAGHANGRNPLSIVIPCHRVIGANGTLTGFAGGLGTKATLLELEGVRGVQEPASLFADEMMPIVQTR
jgi:methylated-DNA-[protein]-cysteine S-methyltransferase